MGGLERRGDLPRDFQRFVKRNRSLPNAFRECGAFHQLHDQEVWTYVKETADVGMVERGDYASFTLESFVEPFGGNLNGDITVQARIASAVDFAHAAGTDRGKYFVGAEFFARRKRHVSESA